MEDVLPSLHPELKEFLAVDHLSLVWGEGPDLKAVYASCKVEHVWSSFYAWLHKP